MSSIGAANLNLNNKQYDTFVYDASKSLINYKPIDRRANTVTQFQDIYPTNQGNGSFNFGGQVTFEIDGANGDYLNRIYFSYTRSAEANSLVCAFEDFEAYSSIDNVKVFMENQDGFTEYGDVWKWEMLARDSLLQRQREAETQNGYNTLAERKAFAAISQLTVCRLRLVYDDINKSLPLLSLTGKLKIQITMKPISYCCYAATGAPSFTLSNPILRIRTLHGMPAQTDSDYQKVHTTGLAWKMPSKEFHRNVQIPASTTLFRLPLSNLKNSHYLITGILRKNSEVYGGSNSLNTVNFQNCTRYWIENAGTIVTPKYEINDTLSIVSDFGPRVLGYNMFPGGQKGLPFMYIPFIPEEKVADPDNFWGGRYFAMMTNPELVIQFELTDVPSVGLTLDVWGDYNQLHITQKGLVRQYLKI